LLVACAALVIALVAIAWWDQRMPVPVSAGMTEQEVRDIMGPPSYDTRLTRGDPDDGYVLIYDKGGLLPWTFYSVGVLMRRGTVQQAHASRLDVR